MIISIKYFGLLTDIVQKKEEQLIIEEETISVGFLKNKMESQNQELKNTFYSIAINQVLAGIDQTINDKDTIAFLPPFAGG